MRVIIIIAASFLVFLMFLSISSRDSSDIAHVLYNKNISIKPDNVHTEEIKIYKSFYFKGVYTINGVWVVLECVKLDKFLCMETWMTGSFTYTETKEIKIEKGNNMILFFSIILVFTILAIIAALCRKPPHPDEVYYDIYEHPY